MSLLGLPTELILIIAEALEQEGDINALVQASRRLYYILNTYLYRHNVRTGSSALIWAARNGQEETTRMLLQENANVEVRDVLDHTALYLAVHGGHEEITRILVTNGADVNADETEKPAIALACHKGYYEIVKILLEAGANPNTRGLRCDFALFSSVLSQSDQKNAIVRLLIDHGADIMKQNVYGDNALGMASFNGNEELVLMLLDAGADVNGGVGHFYGGALQCASYNGHEHIVKILLERGANVNAHGGRFHCSLRAASYKGHERVIKILLQHGADINVTGGHYTSALYAACLNGHEEIVRLLINEGADVNTQGAGDFGNALQAASFGGNEQLVHLLLNNGANAHAIGGSLGSAIHAACAGSGEFGADLNKREQRRRIVQQLIERGADVNVPAINCTVAIQKAALYGDKELVTMLLDNGAKINANYGHHGSPLQAAASRGHVEVVKLLLERGADLGVYGRSIDNVYKREVRSVIKEWKDRGQ